MLRLTKYQQKIKDTIMEPEYNPQPEDIMDDNPIDEDYEYGGDFDEDLDPLYDDNDMDSEPDNYL